MLAAGLRLALLAELLILAALGIGLIRAGQPSAAVLPGLLLLALGWRVLLSVASFVVAGPGPRAGWRRWLAAVWRETVLMLQLYSFDQVFPPRRKPPRLDERVLLVHGYLCNRGVWGGFERGLEAAGWGCRAVELDPRYHDMRRCFAELDAALAGFERPPWLIGHSMGGLLARWYAFRHPERVAGVIALGAPFKGTRLAGVLGGSESGPPWPGCRWLALMNAEIASHPPAHRPLSIYSDLDNIVSPAESSVVDDADCVCVGGLGHLSLVRSGRVLQCCLQRLEGRLDRPAGQPAADSRILGVKRTGDVDADPGG